jgi:hypothetical protein
MTASRGEFPQKRLAIPVLSIEQLWPIAFLAGVFIVMRSLPIRPHDFWWHIAIGRQIVNSGQIPLVDNLSYTALGQPYTYTSFWLMEILLYWLYAAGGAALVLFVHRLMITATYALVLAIAYRQSGSLRSATVATLVAVLVGMSSWNVRPQVIAFPLSAVMLWAIYSYRRDPRPYLLVIFPLATVAWANSHGSFVVGYVLLAIWLADECWLGLKGVLSGRGRGSLRRAVPPLIALALSAAAALLNPRGPALFRYVMDLAGNPLIQANVMEWAPPSFATFSGGTFLIVLLGSAAVLAVSPRRPSLFQMLTFLAFGGLSLKTARFELWFGMTMAPVLAEHLYLAVRRAGQALSELTEQAGSPGRFAQPSSGPRRQAKRQSLNYLLAGVIILVVLLTLPWWQEQIQLPGPKAYLISPETPVAATEFLLRERPPGRVFNDQAFGSYLGWAAQPAYPVFVDTRLELYPLQTWRDYATISTAGYNWEQLTDQYGINTLMIDPVNQPGLLNAAGASSRWRRLYQDDRAAIFARSSSR